MRSDRLFTLCSIAVLAGCNGITTVSAFPTTVTVNFGAEFRIADPELTVRFAEVLQDSRCPVDLTCVQAGSATLRFSLIESNGALNTLLLETGRPGEASHGLTFRLVEVEPAPRSTRPIDPRDYKARVEVTR
jgi:hypothetical protein